MPPEKQRHTARRILARLVDEHGATDLSYSTVRDHFRKRRPQILAEAGKALQVGLVPQTHPPAAEGEVDFHDLWVILCGVKTKTALFTMRLSYSGRAAHRAFDPGSGGVPGPSSRRPFSVSFPLGELARPIPAHESPWNPGGLTLETRMESCRRNSRQEADDARKERDATDDGSTIE